MRRTDLLVVCSVFGAVAACGSDDTGGTGGAGPTNQDPVITALSVDREAVVTAGRVNVTVEANDPDGDVLQFMWTTTVGALSALEGEGPLVWTAPGERGTGTVTVTVDDGNGGTAEASVDIDVLGWLPSSAAGAVPSGLQLKSVGFVSPEEGWLAGGGETQDVPHIFHYTGGQWVDETQADVGHMHAVSAVAADNVWVTGGQGLAFHWDGMQWTEFMIPGGCVHGMDFLHAEDGWVTPAHGQPYMRRYTGGAITAWQQFTMPATSGLHAVSMVSADDGWSVGNGGAMFRFDGTNWAEQANPVVASLHAVEMISAEDGWAVGAVGTALRYDGTAWTQVDTGLPPAVTLFSVFAVDSQNVWMVGSQGTILFFDGEILMPVPSPVASELHGVYFNDVGDGWIVGHDSTILHFE